MIPKELIDNPAFDGVDYGSKLLYGLMLNRASLSAINPNFIDDNGNVYIIYTVEQVIADMRCSRPTAVNMLKQLDNMGLIEKRRLGQGKPSILYIKDFGSLDFQKSKKLTSESKKNELPKVQKIDCSNTDNSKNNFSNTDISIYPAKAKPKTENLEPADPEPINMIDNEKIENPEITKKMVADKICLSELIAEQPGKEEKISELYDIVCEVLTTDDADKIRVAKKQLSAVSVKQKFLKLGKEHIIYVLDCLEKNGGNIKDNSKGYIITALYNSIHSIEYYKPHSQSAFKDNDSSKPKVNYALYF